MIKNANALEQNDVVNFGSSTTKRLGKVISISSLNNYMKTIKGVCICNGEELETHEVNKQPMCVFDDAYITHYISINK